MEVLSPNIDVDLREKVFCVEDRVYEGNELMSRLENTVMLLFFDDEDVKDTNMTKPKEKVEEQNLEEKIPENLDPKNEEKSNEEVKTPESETKTEEITRKQVFTILPPMKLRQENMTTKSAKKSKKKTKLKEKTPKKWQHASNCDMGFNLTLFPRPTKSTEFEGNIDNLLLDIERELDVFEKSSENFQAIVELESDPDARKQLRRDRHHRVQKAHKQIKTKYCRNVRNNKGRKKLFIHHRVLARVEIDLARVYLHYPQSKPRKAVEPDSVSTRKSNIIRNNNSRSRGTWQNTNRGAPAQNLAYAIDTTNNPGNFEADILSLLINLQHRDLTPEDYEILSALDQSVAPKTVSENTINSFKTEKVGEYLAGTICSVCLEPYTIGQECKRLPCLHYFHTDCIVMWLTNSSMNCPLDGLPVDQ